MSEFCGDHEEKAVKNETCEGQQDGQGSRSGQTGRRAEGGDPANDEPDLAPKATNQGEGAPSPRSLNQEGRRNISSTRASHASTTSSSSSFSTSFCLSVYIVLFACLARLCHLLRLQIHYGNFWMRQARLPLRQRLPMQLWMLVLQDFGELQRRE
ncbi:uncharacterized protein [Physcomitrium patens]|uniref:uncharacterized protein n=1 Tax=Physcomitrium patens TaxID=3218 RepID=UPI003CCE06CE